MWLTYVVRYVLVSTANPFLSAYLFFFTHLLHLCFFFYSVLLISLLFHLIHLSIFKFINVFNERNGLKLLSLKIFA